MKIEEKEEQFITEEQLNKIYDHKMRSMIVQLLNMYRELSLSQLSKIMKKNKTTIQYHIGELRNNNIIRVSRVSQADSRGSIPTKYYKINHINLDHHQSFTELKKITNFPQRIDGYKKFLFNLKSCIVNLLDLLAYAEEGVESSLRRISQLEKNPDILNNEVLNELDEYIQDTNSCISIFSTAKSPFLDSCKEVPEMYNRIEKIEENFYKEERNRLKKLGKSNAEIQTIFQNEEEYSEGYQIITVLHPIKNLINAKLDNE